MAKTTFNFNYGLFALFFSLAIWLPIQAQAQPAKKRVDATAFYQVIQTTKNPLIIDVRPAYLFQENRIKGAVLAEDQKALEALTGSVSKNKVILVYCQIGDRSKKAVKVLRSKGFANVYELDDGLQTWQEAALPLETEIIE